jgi:hypothetical protein
VSHTGELALVYADTFNHAAVLNATLSDLRWGRRPRGVAEGCGLPTGSDGTLAVAHYVNGRVRLEYPIGKFCMKPADGSATCDFPAGDKIAFLDHSYWPDDQGTVAK